MVGSDIKKYDFIDALRGIVAYFYFEEMILLIATIVNNKKNIFIVSLILLFSSFLTVKNSLNNSYTADEPLHIATGLEIYQTGKYTLELQHPPVARAAIAFVPWLYGYSYVPGELLLDTGKKTLYQGDVDDLITKARLGVLPFLWLLLIFVYLWANKLAGSLAAYTSLILVATCPPILAHAGLATLDVAAAAFVLITLFYYFLLMLSPTYFLLMVFTICNALAICIKFSSVPFLAIVYLASGCWWLLSDREVLKRFIDFLSLAKVFSMFLFFVIALWGCYGFDTISLSDSMDDFERKFNIAAKLFPFFEKHKYEILYISSLELPAFIVSLPAGIMQLLHHNSLGHMSYIFGETGTHGWWYFYFVSFFFKLPIVLLLPGMVVLVLWVYGKIYEPKLKLQDIPILSLVTILLYASFFSQINLGIRHLLLIIPLLAIAIGFTISSFHKSTRIFILCMTILCSLVLVLREEGEYLSYFNFFGGDHPEKLLLDSDFEWGQDFNRLAIEIGKHPINHISLGLGKTGAPGATDFKRLLQRDFSIMQQDIPVVGWFAVSQSWQAYKGINMDKCLTRTASVGKTIVLYYTATPIVPANCTL